MEFFELEGPFHHFVVRGNTLSVLCNLVQQYVIDTLEQAVLLAAHRTSDSNEYPILKKVDILRALTLAEHMTPRRKHLRIIAHREQFNSETVTTECRNKIVNHLSRMAGATILEYGTNELIWQKIMEMMYALISFCDSLHERDMKYSVYAGQGVRKMT